MRRVLMMAAVLVATAVSPAQAADDDLASRVPQFPWVSSYGGWTVWSEYTEGKYYLLARIHRKTTLLPVPANRITHDPGVGRGPNGRPTAVYQRCTGQACSIWAFDLEKGTQRKIGGLGKIRRQVKRASDDNALGAETHPQIWGKRVVFYTLDGGKDVVRVGPSVAGGGPVKSLPMHVGVDGVELVALALGTKHVMALWQDDLCYGRCIGLYLVGIASGRQQLIDDAVGTADCTAYLQEDLVRFDGSAFRWDRDLSALNSGDTRCDAMTKHLRYNPATGRTTSS